MLLLYTSHSRTFGWTISSNRALPFLFRQSIFPWSYTHISPPPGRQCLIPELPAQSSRLSSHLSLLRGKNRDDNLILSCLLSPRTQLILTDNFRWFIQGEQRTKKTQVPPETTHNFRSVRKREKKLMRVAASGVMQSLLKPNHS